MYECVLQIKMIDFMTYRYVAIIIFMATPHFIPNQVVSCGTLTQLINFNINIFLYYFLALLVSYLQLVHRPKLVSIKQFNNIIDRHE